MSTLGRLARIRAVPWLLFFEAARTVRAHYLDDLSPSERRRVIEILRHSHGNPMAVTPRERDELRRLAGKIDLRGMARDLAPVAVRHQRGRHHR